jgi:hypothetical protein
VRLADIIFPITEQFSTVKQKLLNHRINLSIPGGTKWPLVMAAMVIVAKLKWLMIQGVVNIALRYSDNGLNLYRIQRRLESDASNFS